MAESQFKTGRSDFLNLKKEVTDRSGEKHGIENRLRKSNQKDKLKAELLDCLNGDDDDNFSMDGDGSRLPPRDMTDSVSHPLRIIPFDDQGRDPASLVGRRIQRFQLAMGEGFILHTDQGQVTITYNDKIPFSKHSDIAVDAALLEGLKSVEQITDVLYRGDEEITRAEHEMQKKKAGNLLIVEAAVGMRKCPDMGDYIVGIKCEGMEKMGFVFAEMSSWMITMGERLDSGMWLLPSRLRA